MPQLSQSALHSSHTPICSFPSRWRGLLESQISHSGYQHVLGWWTTLSSNRSSAASQMCALYLGQQCSSPGWLCAPNEPRDGTTPTFSRTISSFFSLFLLACHSHVYSPHLVLAPSLSPASFHQCVQCSKSLEMLTTCGGTCGWLQGCVFWKLQSEFYQEGAMYYSSPVQSQCLEHSRH